MLAELLPCTDGMLESLAGDPLGHLIVGQAAEITYGPDLSETPPDVSDQNPGRHIWTTWRYDWMLDGPGEYYIQVRATDADGNSTELDPAGTDRMGGYNAGMEISVRVT